MAKNSSKMNESLDHTVEPHADHVHHEAAETASANGHKGQADQPSRQHFPSVSHPTPGTVASEPQIQIVHRASAYSVAQEQLTRVAAAMGLDDDMIEYLGMPRRELIVHFPVIMDDDSIRMFTGFRVHHNTTLGPTKGGIRYHPDVTLDECR